MNAKEIDLFEKLQLRLEGIYNEIKALSSKRPDDAINLCYKFFMEILFKNRLSPYYH